MVDWTLGQTSSRYETGGRGAGTVSTGIGDNGGVSYGSYQLSTNEGTVREFLDFDATYAARFKGLTPGTKAFNQQWETLAKEDPVGFHAAQHGFIQHKFYDVQTARLQVAGIDLGQRGPAVQDMLWSTAVQFRGLTKGIVTGALAGKDLSALSDADIVSAVQDYKIDHNSTLFAKSKSLWPGLLARAGNEKQDLMDLARSYGGDRERVQKTPLSLQQRQTLAQFKEQVGDRLAARGLTADQIEKVGLAALRHLDRLTGEAKPKDFLLSKDGASVAVRHESGQISEFSVADALSSKSSAPDAPVATAAEPVRTSHEPALTR